MRVEKGTESTSRFLEHLREQHHALADLIRNYPDWAFPAAGTAATVLDAGFRGAVLRWAC